MKHGWLALAGAIGLIALSAWALHSFSSGPPAPAGAVPVRIQLPSSDDQAFLVTPVDGSLTYLVRDDDGTARTLTPDELALELRDGRGQTSALARLLNASSPTGIAWVTLGLFGQLLFTGRMLVQWLASERSRRSVIPTA